MGIVVVGSVAFDDVITPFGSNINAPGGSATYFSLAASYFTKVKLVAVIGKDFPKKHIDFLKKKGINTQGLEIKQGKTFRWKGSYVEDLDNAKTLETHLNLFQDFQPELPDSYKNEDILFLANIDPDLQQHVISMMKPRLIAADTMNHWIRDKRKSLLRMLKSVDILIINEHEARMLTGEANLLKAGKAVISCGPDHAIIKKGEHGLLFMNKNGYFASPAYPLEEVVDPTGAGDTFAGGFLGYLSGVRKIDECSIRRALVYGTIVASFVVEKFDIKAHYTLTRGQIEKRLREFRRICRF